MHAQHLGILAIIIILGINLSRLVSITPRPKLLQIIATLGSLRTHRPKPSKLCSIGNISGFGGPWQSFWGHQGHGQFQIGTFYMKHKANPGEQIRAAWPFWFYTCINQYI